MTTLINVAIYLGTLAGMEVFSWAVHKYLFHGILWRIHQTHHLPSRSRFEWNDVFSVSFASVAILLIVLGYPSRDYRLWMGLGITTYGFIYFVLHDIFVHGRLKAFKTRNRYLLALRRAHKMHHKSLLKHPSESYGLLWIARRYYKGLSR